MKFRKKPIVIEAEQYFKGKPEDVEIEGLIHNWDNNPMTPGKVSIETLEGYMDVSEGDWIITGIKGEKYPCKPDIFDATYERVT